MNEPYLCACSREVTDFIWVVLGVWYCSEPCGSMAAHKAAIANVPAPTSQARYPEIMASGT